MDKELNEEQVKEYYELYKNNMPFIMKGFNGLKRFLNNYNVIEKRNDKDELLGFSIVEKSTIYILVVKKEDRCKGIGSLLLNESEEYIKSQGYKKVNIGVGGGYLYPGVPTNIKPYNEDILNEDLYKTLDNDAVEFFMKRGYKHHERENNIFDMHMSLSGAKFYDYNIGDSIDGIKYTFASIDDIDEVCKCTDDAEKDFTPYYKGKYLYQDGGGSKALIAKDGNTVCGCVMVGMDIDESRGSVGCTSVRHSYRGRKIATNMIILGTKYLKEKGIKYASLEYTYSGLDKMYGKAGYNVSTYYFMGYKKL